MAIIKYSPEEVFLTIINVLNFVVGDLRNLAYKIGLKQNLRENGMLLLQTPDPKVLAQLNDPLTLMLKTFADDLLELYHAIAIGQQIDVTTLGEDERVAEVSSEVYWNHAADPFFYLDDLKASVLNYIRFLPSLVGGLEKLIVEQQFEHDQGFVTLYLDRSHFEQLQHAELPAVKLMGELGCLVYSYQTNIAEYVDGES